MKRRYITGFDGLRTLGVIAVILYHVYREKFPGGYLGVVLFFVLSGYLITDILIQDWHKNGDGKLDLLQFWKNRLKRLYPILVTVILTSSVYMLIFQRDLLKGLRMVTVSSLLNFNNWWQIAQGNSYFADFTGQPPFKHIYSLSIEGQFYFIWPILFIILMKLVKKHKTIFYILSLGAIASAIWMWKLYVPGADPTRVYYGTDTRIFSILMGVALAYIWPSNKIKANITADARKVLNYVSFGSLAFVILFMIFAGDQLPFIYRGGMFLFSMASALLVAMVAHPSLVIGKLFSNPLFTYLGQRSYGIYLWQLPVFTFFDVRVANPHALLNIVLEIVVVLALSEISYRLIEKPFRRKDYGQWVKSIIAFWRGGNLKSIKKVPQYVLTAFVLLGVGTIAFSPTKDADAEKIAAQILAQQEKAKAALKAEKDRLATADAATVANTMAKYGVDDLTARKAALLNAVAVGDSVMLAAATDIQAVFPNMRLDGAIGRQATSGAEALQNLINADPDYEAVLIGLGTNGTVDQASIDGIMKVAGDKPVYWVNVYVPTRGWQGPNNQLLTSAAKQYKNLTLIDWYDFAADHQDLVWSDQIHPKEGVGTEAYTKLLLQALIKVTPEEAEAAKKEAEEKAKAEATESQNQEPSESVADAQ